MDDRYISPCQCHLSAELKMAYKIKACLTGSVINATLNSCTAAIAAIASLFIPYTYHFYCLSISLSHSPFLTLSTSTSPGKGHVRLQQNTGNLKQEGFY